VLLQHYQTSVLPAFNKILIYVIRLLQFYILFKISEHHSPSVALGPDFSLPPSHLQSSMLSRDFACTPPIQHAPMDFCDPHPNTHGHRLRAHHSGRQLCSVTLGKRATSRRKGIVSGWKQMRLKISEHQLSRPLRQMRRIQGFNKQRQLFWSLNFLIFSQNSVTCF